MADSLDDLIVQLEIYRENARSQIDVDVERISYWRGVRFGVELALFEARKRQAASAPLRICYEITSKLIFEDLEKLIVMCQARIPRDLLVYNVRLARYDLLKAIRQQTNVSIPNTYEQQANSDSSFIDP